MVDEASVDSLLENIQAYAIKIGLANPQVAIEGTSEVVILTLGHYGKDGKFILGGRYPFEIPFGDAKLSPHREQIIAECSAAFDKMLVDVGTEAES